MRKITLINLLAVLIMFSSCYPILKVLNGVHKPRFENEENIMAFLEKKRMNPDNIYIAKDTSSFKWLGESFKGGPEIIYFNKNGYFMDLRNLEECNNQNYTILDSLSANMVCQIDSTKSLNELLGHVMTFDGRRINQSSLGPADMYIAISWAMFMGTTNEKAREWEEKIDEKKSEMNIQVIKVNMDLQEVWFEGIDTRHIQVSAKKKGHK